MAKQTNKEERFQLPINIIKRDLIKTVMFTVFALVFLTILNLGDVTYNDIVMLVKGIFRS